MPPGKPPEGLVKRWPILHPKTAQLDSVRGTLEILGLQALSGDPPEADPEMRMGAQVIC